MTIKDCRWLVVGAGIALVAWGVTLLLAWAWIQ